MKPIRVQRSQAQFLPDSTRVLIRPFIPQNPQRVANILARGLMLPEEEAIQALELVMSEFKERHSDIEKVLLHYFHQIRPQIFSHRPISRERQLFIGSLFTGEYALESAALFNPSIVIHPDQSGVPEGSLRFIVSLRATGEGHISSIEFRSGTIDQDAMIQLDPVSRYVTAPDLVPNPTYYRAAFTYKLQEMGFDNEIANTLLEALGDDFTFADLEKHLKNLQRRFKILSRDEKRTIECVRWLAESNYQLRFDPALQLHERIIFPVSANESNGIEDARFVRFCDEDGSVTYYATYTAYNGRVILPQLIETKDFLNFRVLTLNGRAVQNKGMALFPRKVDGRYVMLSRQDDENLFIMFSDNPHYWQDYEVLLRPAEFWELAKIGNCGSPLETEKGWLVITHGVGPMRKYCIGAILLDLNDPTKVIGRLRTPLLEPENNEREGYVPNVVYTCGALIHGRHLILPYAMSDTASRIAIIHLDELLAALLETS